MKVAVYRNLNNGMYSVQCRQGDMYGKVIAHCDAIQLKNTTFSVQPAGREKVRLTRKKNVHAFVVGYIEEASNWQPQYPLPWWAPIMGDSQADIDSDLVSYNPYLYDTFMYLSRRGPTAIRCASEVLLNETGVYAKGVNNA